ncbi:glycosyltransferase [bacterium]|nr:glycosyltransferase [bacterium]
MTEHKPIIVISSWVPRLCGIATFAEEAVEFIKKANPERQVYIISHTDGRGKNIFPIIDMKRKDWYMPVLKKIKELKPYIVHLEHEYGLYNYIDETGKSDNNTGFLTLIKKLKKNRIPTIVEPHTVHGRLREQEELFIKKLAQNCTVLLFKCAYQKWRLGWTFNGLGWKLPSNIMIVPHGARPDRKYGPADVPFLKEELGLPEFIDKHVVGLVGWIQNNKRWDLIIDIWEELQEKIETFTGQQWCLLGAGKMRDPHHLKDYKLYKNKLEILQKKGKAKFYEFIPRGEIYYQVMGICDFILLPSFDETQSGTLARIIALNKPYITTAPLEGLTSQTVESKGGLLFSNMKTLKDGILRLATDEPLRFMLGGNLRKYLDNVVSWEVVAKKYNQAYQLADNEIRNNIPVSIPLEFKDI